MIKRRLWHDSDDGRVEILQDELIPFNKPLIILGEAGMGKSHLLDWLKVFPGYAHCTARQLINRTNPSTLLVEAHTLLIDALDEVSAQKEGDAVDLVLRQLGHLNYPHFVLSSRVADWRSATGLEAIYEQYSERPLELHLTPFDDGDAANFLSSSLDREKATEVIDHFNSRGLNSLLGNPQTLDFIARIAKSGKLPDTRRELFEQAIEELRTEYRDSKSDAQPARDVGLDAAGAAFAGIILTGSEVIVRKSQANITEGELQLAEILELPGGEATPAVLGTRLFKANGPDRFSYLHRRVGEYLGARWLAKQADTPRKRKRLLSLFHSYDVVPSSIRGIHAWLLQDPLLADAVIFADPIGVIEYGDADHLSANQARSLLQSLEALSKENPKFYLWGQQYALRSISHPELIEDLRSLITSPDTSYSLVVLILESIKGTQAAARLAGELSQIVLEQKAVFVVRSTAGETLAAVGDSSKGLSLIHRLNLYGDEDSIRLAVELVDDIGYEQVGDQLIADLVVSWVKTGARTIGVLSRLERDLPTATIVGLLDCLITKVKKPTFPQSKYPLAEFVYYLIGRSVESNDITVEKLWFWLDQFGDICGPSNKNTQKLADVVRKNRQLTLDLQYFVLFKSLNTHSFYKRVWLLRYRVSGLSPNSEDVVELLEKFDPNDRNDLSWKRLLRITPQNESFSAEARAAAKKFAMHRPDLLIWIDKLAITQVPKWKAIKEDRRERRNKAKQAVKFAEHREYYKLHTREMLTGNHDFLLGPAMAYLKMLNDIDSGAPPFSRIVQWLGSELAEVSLKGFEAVLSEIPPMPSAYDIAHAFAENKEYESGLIIVAGLAERLRTNIGFGGLVDERLMAGLFVLQHSQIAERAGISGLQEIVESTLRERGVWEDAIRLYIEPQLEARLEHVKGLSAFISDEANAEILTGLAYEWLVRFTNMAGGPESELIDVLLISKKHSELEQISSKRMALDDDFRRRNWDAVSLIVSFQATAKKFEVSPIEPELLWSIRDKTNELHRVSAPASLNTSQAEWIVSKFRTLWPVVGSPKDGRVRGMHSAQQYIIQLINQLGNDPQENARAALIRLKEATTDGYTPSIKSVIAEQTRNIVESTYSPPSLSAVNAISRDLAPEYITDLKAIVINELQEVQAKIKSDDAESWRGFYDDQGVPFIEERCRDHLLGLLRQGSKELTFDPETHVAADKEVDITCSVGKLRLPVEIKGQWHRDLWVGADNQLDKQYTPDWRAHGHGIYLVFWFGHQDKENKRLKASGKGKAEPACAHELQEMLTTRSKAASSGRVTVFVLDLARLRF